MAAEPIHGAEPESAGAPGAFDRAFAAARAAAEAGEVPVGAVVVRDGTVLAVAHNQPRLLRDPTAHAEILAIRAACAAIGDERLVGCDLYVTLEPCPMCAGAVVLSRVGRVVLGAWDPKLGACGSVWDVVRDRRATHRAEVVGGVLEEECGAVVRRFFERHRG